MSMVTAAFAMIAKTPQDTPNKMSLVLLQCTINTLFCHVMANNTY